MSPPKKNSWLMARLDSLLSEPLRQAPPSELTRHRVLVGSTCFLLLFALLYAASALIAPSTPVLPGLMLSGCYLVTLVLARRARSLDPPAMFLLSVMSIGIVSLVFRNKHALPAGVHAGNILLPALAVYLVGARRGFFLTLFFALALTVGYPLYRISLGLTPEVFTVKELWISYTFAGASFLGVWVIGALHSTARNAAQESLERTLKELRDREGQLSSLIESTDDVVISLDTQGRVLVANSTARRLYRKNSGGGELQAGQPLFSPDLPGIVYDTWRARLNLALQGQRLRFEETSESEGVQYVLDICLHPIVGEGGRVVGATLFSRDITARKEAEIRLGEMHRALVDASRQAGMAEIATGVLHNVGNTLNSVNISTSLVIDQLRQSRVTGLGRATGLLREHSGELGAYLGADPQGQKLPAYLIAVAEQLQEEREALLREMKSLSEGVEHIKSVVSMQQKHARAAGAVEQLSVPQLIDEALRLNAVSFDRLNIRLERDYADMPPVYLDRHKLLQILINLLSNARHALMDSGKEDKRLTIRVRPSSEDKGWLSIQVEDNGVGIAPENLARMFAQGFTTKKTGHGFGLHISALAATEMGGRLTCTSPGVGQGVTFTLELPMGGKGPAA